MTEHFVKIHPKEEAIQLILAACQSIQEILEDSRIDLRQLGYHLDCISQYLFSVSLNATIIQVMKETDNVARLKEFKPVFMAYVKMYE